MSRAKNRGGVGAAHLATLLGPSVAQREMGARLQQLIPGGAHTYSKGDDQFPANAPRVLTRGRGAFVWDADGNRYVDWGMGLCAVVLGHAYEPVLDAVRRQLPLGASFLRPCTLELEFAEQIVGLIDSAEMVKFAKNGSDVTAGAVRLARAYTGRDRIALCRQHPFFSFHDWFIGTTEADSGIPKFEKELGLKFDYNDVGSLEAVFEQYPDEIAAVILEPAAVEEPRDGFLQRVIDLAHREGALVILDEMITGFRWHLKGAQHLYGVRPDLTTFGKAIGNGFSVSVLAGRREVMELGGIHHDRPRVFLLSATHGAEAHALAAAMATVREIEAHDVVDHLWRVGRQVQDGINSAAAQLGIADHVRMVGFPCRPALVTLDRLGRPSDAFRTLFLQEMAGRGVLVPQFAVSYAHKAEEIELTLAAAYEALEVYREALERGLERFLDGPAVKPVFRKFN